MKSLPLHLLLLILLTAMGSLGVHAGPSAREKEILANAKPGVPVTLPDRKSDIVIKSPFASGSSGRSELRPRQHTLKKKTSVKTPARALRVQGFWFGEGEGQNDGKRRVVIDLSQQVAQVWAGDRLVGQSPVSTGRAGFETPSGQFTITQKSADHHSNLYGSWVDSSGKYQGDADFGDKAPKGLTYAPAPMPYFLRITGGGIGMHSGYVTGAPASHGCIRLPYNMAQNFFEYLPLGTPVEIMD